MTWVPVSRELLDDVFPLAVWANIELDRLFTAEAFGEDWHDLEDEVERLEFGAPVDWDDTDWDECA